ncbi:calcineurin-like phosphoesterase C-terminal domain-containing protein [Sphingobacterium faecale]|uniref:Calcineurin-like phosphoesterase C-terminal domain-containing protein n=1 Tax=Sphingobacterium faecale TaxID=2803775 RepID=A0ABS1R209_9SPHI|nr:calcineurin-like phosphoesterase family protein [Sphingobacterium faecale]MBL1408722.1 calcineurin-like phosphoesterase C-terminal domain-containing protein [Sphingobacterium faecale]
MKYIKLILRSPFLYSLFITLLSVACYKDNHQTSTGPRPGASIELPRVKLIDGNNVYGYILDEDNNPIANITVTDGFSVVKTDNKGVYQLKKNDKAKFVYYSTPSDYQIAVETNNRKIPLFYRTLTAATTPQQHNFTLRKKTNMETNFTLFGLGDPQVTDDQQVARFVNETLADIKSELADIKQPVYGIALGDIVNDKDNQLNNMKTRLGSTSMPIFSTIGNHDKFAASPNPKTNDLFEKVFGPTYYSFDIGEVHFVCLDNVVFTSNTSYSLGISQAQIDWLEKDLSQVPKEKMLIVYYHMPIRGSNFSTRSQFLNLIKDFKEVHMLCGHTHYMENYIHNVSGKEMYEHVHGATCGAWWRSNINGDGTPNGYMIYQIEGTTVKDWIYKPTKLPRDFQFRLHWGNIDFGGQYGLFNYGQSSNTLVANIWNADPAWKAEVYMDGKKLGDMILKTSAPLNEDAWSKGYHIGVLNRSADSYSTTTKHLYSYQISNPNNTLKVVVTDRFGRKYEQTHADIVFDFESAWQY